MPGTFYVFAPEATSCVTQRCYQESPRSGSRSGQQFPAHRRHSEAADVITRHDCPRKVGKCSPGVV